MSRERISKYKVTVASGNVTVHIEKPSGITLQRETSTPEQYKITVYDDGQGEDRYFIWDRQEGAWYEEGESPIEHWYTASEPPVLTESLSEQYIYAQGSEGAVIGAISGITYTPAVEGDYDAASQRIVIEAIRLIIDETALVVLCSSMKKTLVGNITPSSEQGYDIAITFAIPSGKTVTATDAFTIEFDWALPAAFPTDYAKQSNVGTSSDPALESGSSLFAVLKAVWNKVVNIYSALADGTNGLSAIKSAIPSVSGLATETSVKDGNDTAIGLLKDQTNGLVAIKGAIPTVANIQNGLATESNATSNKNAILQAIADNAGVPTLTIPSTTASQELAPNTLYVFSSRSAALTLTLGTPIVGIANEYHLFLVTDSTTAPTVTWPSGISWNGGSAPTIAADKTYEISILNNVAAFFEI